MVPDRTSGDSARAALRAARRANRFSGMWKTWMMGVALVCAGCAGEQDVAMRVGEVSFAESRIAALREDQRRELADIASIGQLASTGRLGRLAEPLATQQADLSRLRVMPFELAARARPEQAVREAYAADPEWRLTVRHVVRLVPADADAATRAAARDVAREVARRAAAGEDFAALAAEFSEEPGAAERGGLLEPGRRGSWVEPFWEAASALRPGEVSPVVETVYGYHVLRLDAREPVPFDSVDRSVSLRRAIPAEVARLAMEAWVATRPPILVDTAAALAAREAMRTGPPAESVVASSGETGAFDARELMLARAALDPPARRDLDLGDAAAYLRWIQNRAMEDIWAESAAGMGVTPEPAVAVAAADAWLARLRHEATALGFSEGMPIEEVETAALRALAATDQESILARAPLPGYRPILRAILPLDPGPVAGPDQEG